MTAEPWVPLPADERARHDALKQAYGAKFSAISAALGHACEAQRQYEEGDEPAALDHLQRVIDILIDA